MFIYNQIGGIDEASLDRLSLVTEMSKRIRVRASGEKSIAYEIGQFSPIFVWILRDFYLDLVEDNRRITPRDYLEIALSPFKVVREMWLLKMRFIIGLYCRLNKHTCFW